MKRYALIGAAGFVAPRHMRAIRDTGGELVAACDPHDSVGVLDSYFPGCRYFPEVERFDRHLDKLRREGNGIDYLVVCTPNWLHDAHCRMGLRLGADVICEKPVALHVRNVRALMEIERETGHLVHPILQLRCMDVLADVRAEAIAMPRALDVVVDYKAPRGRWYARSWKGDARRSGGPLMNIGIHIFDALHWMFGSFEFGSISSITPDMVQGNSVLRRKESTARVAWSVSVAPGDARRVIRVNDWNETREIELSNRFSDLHTEAYHRIINGAGPTLDDALPSIEHVEMLTAPNGIDISIPISEDR